MDRYRNIIDDWEGFRQACQSHAVKTVRRNRIKSKENFVQDLAACFGIAERSTWNNNFYRLPGVAEPGKSLMHWRGEYYVQEESAAIPVEALDPVKGEKIIDLCAAPGGKTTQIASRIGNEGSVIANDDSSKRLQSLTSNIYRTGSACVSTANYDGRSFPGKQRFDRVLVDAPCTGEGDRCRRDFKPAPEAEREGLSELQRQLLESGLELLKSGGTLVYSTCTIAPEENEAVVSDVLEGSEANLEKVKIDAPHREGLEQFQDSYFGEELSKTLRVYPHHFSSGVIFVAKFSK